MELDWLYALGITIVGLVITSIVHVDEGVIASTGNLTEFKEDMDKLSQRYHGAMDKVNIVTYKKSNAFVDMQFSINSSKLTEFAKKPSFNHFLFYAAETVALFIGDHFTLSEFFVGAALLFIIGFLSRKTALEVNGVGGSKVSLYTKPKDINKVVNELTKEIERVRQP